MKKTLKNKVKMAKTTFYSKFVEDLKSSKPGQWYGKLKRLACYDQVRFEPVKVTSLDELTDKEGAEKIADSMAAISQEYEPLKTTDLPAYLPAKPPPRVTPTDVEIMIKNTKKTKSTLQGDLPHSVTKEFAQWLSEPLAHILMSPLKKESTQQYGSMKLSIQYQNHIHQNLRMI